MGAEKKTERSRRLEKQILVRFETMTFDVPGKSVTSKISWPETLGNLNTL